MAKRNLPIALVGVLREMAREGEVWLEILSPHVGWYYLAPEKPDAATGFLLPYKQTGQWVRAGEILCRIRTLTRERRWRRLPFFRIVVQDIIVTSPANGILYKRYAEDERIKKRKIKSLGNQEPLILKDGFPVEYAELLFIIRPAY